MTDRRKLDDPLAAPLARALAAGLDRSGRECPEAEILALYFDRVLPAGEAARWELHFSSCAHCQNQLAAMARMETSASPAAPETAPAKTTGVSWLWNWRWLAPAAAALGAVAIWVVVNNVTTRPSPAGPAIAQVTQEPAAETPQPAAPAKAEGFETTADTMGKGAATSETSRASGAVSEAGSKLAPKPVQEPQAAKLPTAAAEDALATRALSDRADAARVAQPAERNVVGALQSAAKSDAKKDTPSESAFRVEPQKAKEEAGRESETRAAGIATMTQPAQQRAAGETMQQKPTAAPPLPSPQRANEQGARTARDEFDKRQKAPAQAALDETKKAKAEPASQAAQTAQTVTVESGPTAVNRLRAEEDASGRFRAANVAGSKVVWRLGPAGSIERSADGGATWQRQSSGVTADLLAGSAPSATICWAVGRGGVVLRTTDGSTWSQLGSPTSQDLVVVVATDADRATVTTADGKSYATTDSGRTWRSQ